MRACAHFNTIGDRALEIEPMRQRGGLVTEPEWTVEASLKRLAGDIGLSVATVKTTRWVASRWPKEHRSPKTASYTVHRVLANIEDEAERFAAIGTPPDGKTRWTTDDASRRVGQQVETPITPQEKVTAIHSLARDEEVAAAVTTDFLRRPQVAAKVSAEDKVRVVEEFTRDESVAATAATSLLRRPDVAFKAMSDDTARFQVKPRSNAAGKPLRTSTAPAPSPRPSARSTGRFSSWTWSPPATPSSPPPAAPYPACGTAPWATNERTIVHANVARVRATLDWIETAVDTGKVDVDDELARLLKGE